MAGRDDLPVLVPTVAQPDELPESGLSIAASARLLDPTATRGPTAIATQPPEHAEAWATYRGLPEVRKIIDGGANLLSQCRLYPGIQAGTAGGDRPLLDEDGTPTAEWVTPQLAADCDAVLGRFRDTNGSQRGLVKATAQGWDVVGEAFLVGWPVDDDGNPHHGPAEGQAGERWEIVGRARITRDRKRWKVDLGDGAPVVLPEAAVCYRHWNRDPEIPELPMGWLLAALDPCRDLRVFTAALRSSARSHIVADLLLIPLEAAPKATPLGTVNPAAAGAARLLGPDGQPLSEGTRWATQIEKVIGDAIAEVTRDVQSGRTVINPVLAVAEKSIEHFKRLELGRKIETALENMIEQARKRIADGADSSPEFLFGLGDTNRWNGAQIADDDYRRHFKPKIDGIADCWTLDLLWGGLRALGYPQEIYRQVRVLVDPSGVVAKPDRSKSATEGLTLGAITYAAWREAHGYDESDAPTDEERDALIAAFGRRRPGLGGEAGTGEVNPLAGSAATPEDLARLTVAMEAAARARRESAAQQLSETQDAPAAPPALLGRVPLLGLPDGDAARLRSGRVATAALLDDPERLGAALGEIERLARSRLEEAQEQAFVAALNRAGSKLRALARRDSAMLAVIPKGAPAGDVPGLLGIERAFELAAAAYDGDEDRRDDMFLAALAALLLSFRRIAEDTFARVLAVLGITLSADEVTSHVERGGEVYQRSVLLWADEHVFGQAAQGRTGRAPRGEAKGGTATALGESTSLTVPLLVAARGLAAAGGAPVDAGTTATPEAAGGITFGPVISPHIPFEIEGWVWDYGLAVRSRPWDPHVQLDGVVLTGPLDLQLVGKSPSGGPAYPQDHDGCRCSWHPILGAPKPRP